MTDSNEVIIDSNSDSFSESIAEASFLKNLIHLIPNPVFYIDTDLKFQYCSRSFCDFINVKPEDILNKSLNELPLSFLNQVFQIVRDDLKQLSNTQQHDATKSTELRIHTASGIAYDILFHRTPRYDDSGKLLGEVCVIVDITVHKEKQRDINLQNTIKEFMLEMSGAINKKVEQINFFEHFLQGLIHCFSSSKYGIIYEITDDYQMAILASYGYKIKEALNLSFDLPESVIYQHQDMFPHISGIISEINPANSIIQKCNTMLIDCKSIESVLYIPVDLQNGRQIIISLESSEYNAFDIIDLNQTLYIQSQMPSLYQIYTLNKETLKLSRYDSLTGLMNRGYFNSIVEDRIRLAQRHEQTLSLIMFDLDGLKIVNDNFGHAAGDEYLIHFSKYLENQFRSTDLFARIGGDEFLGIFTTSDPITLKKKMTLLQTLYMDTHIETDDYSFNGRFSFGIGTYPDDADTFDGLMTIADIKMYRDKQQFKNL